MLLKFVEGKMYQGLLLVLLFSPCLHAGENEVQSNMYSQDKQFDVDTTEQREDDESYGERSPKNSDRRVVHDGQRRVYNDPFDKIVLLCLRLGVIWAMVELVRLSFYQ